MECAEAAELSLEKAVSSIQVALCLMGNVQQHMALERRKKLLVKLNLKFMAEDRKKIVSAAPMLLARKLLSWPMPLWNNRKQ